MNEKFFLIYNQNSSNIDTMESSAKNRRWIEVANELEKFLDNYKNNRLNLQEMKIFNFLEKPIEDLSLKPSSDLEKTIKIFIKKIKEEIKENGIKVFPLKVSKDKSDFELNYKNILSIVNIMVLIIENISTKGKTYEAIYDFFFKDKIPEFKLKNPIEDSLKEVLRRFNDVKILNICLYKNQEDNYNYHIKKEKQIKNNVFYMDPKIVFLFGLFYKAFFKSIISINFSLNIPPIDDYFSSNNPYLVNEKQITLKGREYKDIFLCNLIMIKTLKKFQYSTNINFKMYDSYQLELHNILTDIFDSNINIDNYEMSARKLTLHNINGKKLKNLDINKSYNFKPRAYSIALDENHSFIYSNKFNNNFLYFQHLLNLKGNIFLGFTFDFNSLDPLLFSSVNHLLIKFGSDILKLNLILFPKNKFNKRKIAMNNFFYKKFCDNNDNDIYYFFNDKKIYYQYLDDSDIHDRDIFLLKDEKIFDELFFLFNRNLQNLSVILERKINNLLELSIDLSTYNNENVELCNYDNYSCSIVCFLFDLFKIFQLHYENCKINSLEIRYDDFNDERLYIIETIKRKIPSLKNECQLNNLRLNKLNLNISNISLILPFENFPSVILAELILNDLSYKDLNNLINALNNKKDMFPYLRRLDISLGIFYEDYMPLIEILLKESLNKIEILNDFYLKLPLNIKTHELINILYWIKLNHNNNLKIVLSIINDELSQYIGKDYFINLVIDSFYKNKLYLKEKNLIISYKANEDNNSIKLSINKYKMEEFDCYYNLIYSLQKINDKFKKDENKAIFQNIFGFKGNFKRYNVKIEFNK